MTSVHVKEIKNSKMSSKKLQKVADENKDDEKSVDSPGNSNEILPTLYHQLTPALEKEARTKLNETEETREKGLQALRKLIEGEKKLTTPTDDNFLLAFLRARKFNIKKAFKLLKNYWSFRKQYKTIYDTADSTAVKDLIMRSYLGFLLFRDKKGCVVFVMKTALWDPDMDSFESLFLAISGILVYSLEHPATQIAGFRIILDARGVSWKQLKYFTPANFILFVRSTQFCFPARYKGIHILCESKMINFLWNIMYPFLTSKLKKRVFFHGEDLLPLREHIHPSVLPVEFGGQGPCFDNSSFEEIMTNETGKMEEMLKYGYKD